MRRQTSLRTRVLARYLDSKISFPIFRTRVVPFRACVQMRALQAAYFGVHLIPHVDTRSSEVKHN